MRQKKISRSIALVLVALMLFFCLPLTGLAAETDSPADQAASAAGSEVSATADDGSYGGISMTKPSESDGVYQIASVENLAWYANALTADSTLSAKLTADLTFAEGQTWQPINKLDGTLDGDGHKINNLQITGTASLALVKNNAGTIKKLTIASGSITASGSGAAAFAYQNRGLIFCCLNAANVTAGSNVGGIVASPQSKSAIVNCANTGSITATQQKQAGGITGATGNVPLAPIYNCYNTGDISVGEKGQIAGGITSYAGNGDIVNCYTTGNVSGITKVGALIGDAFNANTIPEKIKNSYCLVSDTVNKGKNASGRGTNLDEATIKDEAGMKTLAGTLGEAYAADTDNINNGYPVLAWQKTGVYPAAEGDVVAMTAVTVENGTITITLDRELQYTTVNAADVTLRYTVNGKDETAVTPKKLDQATQDGKTVVTVSFTAIEASTADQNINFTVGFKGKQLSGGFTIAQSPDWKAYAEACTKGDGSEANPYEISTAAQLAWYANLLNDKNNQTKCAVLTKDIDLSAHTWTPIASLKGTFNGQGHKITHIRISEGIVANIGFFNKVQSGGVVKNLVVADSDWDFSQRADRVSYVGGLASAVQSNSYLLNCGSSINIKVDTAKNSQDIGGLAGSASDSAVVNCYATGNIVAARSQLGGLLGSATKTKVRNCYATGDIVNTSTQFGTVYTTPETGGLIGDIFYSEVTNCYSSGSVRLQMPVNVIAVGGAIGHIDRYDPVLKNVFYLKTDTINTDLFGVGQKKTEDDKYLVYKEDFAGSAPYNEAQLKAAASVLGEAFTANDNGYPKLVWEGSTYPENYAIDEKEGLAIASVSATNGAVKVVMNKKLSYRTLEQANFQMKTQLDGEPALLDQKITKIAQDDSGDATVITLSFAKFEETASAQSGKVEVSYLGGAGVQGNMDIAASDQWSAYAADAFAGGAGTAEDPYRIDTEAQLAYLAQSVLKGETYADKYFVLTEDLDLGGKIWTPIGIWKLTNTNKQKPFAGTFDGQGHKIFNLYIPQSTPTKPLFAESVGLFGGNQGTIKNLSISGYTFGTYMGSIAVYNYGTIENCHSSVDMECYVNGTAYGTDGNNEVGGICGPNYGVVKDCTYRGTITQTNTLSNANFGGIASYCKDSTTESAIINCYNYGTIYATGRTGGITAVAANKNGCTIENCFNSGTIVNLGLPTGGIIGETWNNAKTTVKNCYNVGSLERHPKGGVGTVTSGALIGDANPYKSTITVENCYNAGTMRYKVSRCGGLFGDDNAAASNCYYLDSAYIQATPNGNAVGAAVPEKEMKSAAFAAKLGDAFVQDTGNVNNGYPILKGQRSDELTAAPTGLKGQTGKITGLSKDKLYEYRSCADRTAKYIAVPAGSTEIKGLESDNYEVRFAQTEDSIPSCSVTVNVPGDMCGYVDIPGSDVNYSENTYITADPYNTPYGAQLSYQWKIGEKEDGSDAVNIEGATNRYLLLTEDMAGKYITAAISAKGYKGTITVTRVVGRSYASLAPLGLSGFAPTTENGTDGRILGLKADRNYEYCVKDAEEYIAVPAGSTEITGLATGTYNVRYVETAGVRASSPAAVDVPEYNGNVKYITGSVTVVGDGSVGSTLKAEVTGAPEGCTLQYQWQYRGSSVTDSDIEGATNAEYQPTVDLLNAKSVWVTVTAEGYAGKLVAAVPAITKKAAPAAPAVTAVNETAKDADDGKITGLDPAVSYEYKLADAFSYNKVPANTEEISNLAPGTYLVRIVETEDTLASETATAVIKAFGSTAGGGGGGGGSAVVSNKPQLTVGEGGTASADEKGNVTIKANDGYVVKDVTVNGVSKGAVTSLSGLTAKDKVVVTFEKKQTTVGGFTDIADHWGKDAILFTVEKGLFNGVTETTFEPDGKMTRAMLATVLYRMENQPEGAAEAGFVDVKADAWYAEGVNWAAGAKLVNGVGENKFAPDDNISREQLAAMLYRYAQFKKYDVSKQGDLAQFTDHAKVGDWAKEAIVWAVGSGIIQGDNGSINPQGEATRAEVATMLQRFLSIDQK